MPGHGRRGHAGEGAADAVQGEVGGDGGGGGVAARPLEADEPLVGEGEAAPLEAGEAPPELLVLDGDRREGDLRPRLALLLLAAAAAPGGRGAGGGAAPLECPLET